MPRRDPRQNPEDEDSNPMPYNNAQLVAMKKDIADRSFRIKMTGMIISALFAVAAVAAMFFMPSLAASGGLRLIIGGALGAGSVVTNMITMREAKKLEIDEEYLQSYMQGKNYWGAGYRQEVAEHGYAGPGLTMQAPPPGLRGGRPGGPHQGPHGSGSQR